MKNLLYLLFAVCLFSACSSDDDETTQDYTSFTVVYDANIEELPNCVAGYQKDGLWVKIADLGDLKKGQPSKEIILSKFIQEDIYIFTDYITPRRLLIAFSLKENKKNALKIPEDVGGERISDKTNATQYPQ